MSETEWPEPADEPDEEPSHPAEEPKEPTPVEPATRRDPES
jgi:hypothetical protein